MVRPLNNSLILLILVLLTYHNVESTLQSRSKRAVDSAIASAISSKVNPISKLSFNSDLMFIQKVNALNKVSKYSIDGEPDTIYERNAVDSGKDLVILASDEDRIRVKKAKRQYIYLKQYGGNRYAAGLAIIREAGPADRSISIPINGKDSVVELGIYEEHLIPGRSVSNYLAMICITSFTVNCVYNLTLLNPPDKFVKSPPFKQKKSQKEKVQELDRIDLITADGSNFLDNADYFYDLDAETVEGRGFAGMFQLGLVPSLLGGASGLMCGVLAVVGICGTGKNATDTTIINESGVPLDPAMIQQYGGMQGPPVGGPPPGAYGPPNPYGKKRRKRSSGSRKKRAALNPETAHYPGWKTQYAEPAPGLNLKREEDNFFYGMGNCPYQKPSEDLLSSSSPNDVLRFYLGLLRVDCLSTTRIVSEAYLSRKVVTLNADKSFVLGPEVEADLKSDKIDRANTLQISSAIELVSFSRIYQQLKSEKLEPVALSPDGKRKVARSTVLIGKVYLNYIQLVREKARKHLVTLQSIAILNINNIFIKLAQDAQNLERCEACKEDKEINLNGRVYISAIAVYLRRGLSVQGVEDVAANFDKFYKSNADKFEKFVEAFS